MFVTYFVISVSIIYYFVLPLFLFLSICLLAKICLFFIFYILNPC